ncbi:AraC family transcriptional regulator [Peptostreptococcus porci]|uniref:helix-turn-helix domain-containing protein n=1 Tax=Peptostreptococcus porci TaxID=2652282 RepID=UPI002A766B7E|nr:AraC family transcriptional regulator [Peptostreptococcus porci]MDY2794166.1 AraC family transcriptional regulator [Peptostreptococcus porci]MDY4129277.1 AraC family transcriptional regulator [Peptostreptococcus porci]
MNNYHEFVKNYLGVNECEKSIKYCDVGHTFCISNDTMEGIYWFYETENFIVNIHDFFIKKEMLNSNYANLNKFMSFCSSYIITANGESFNPYQTLSSNSLYILDVDNLDKNYRFLLHANSLYLSVGINFKKQMVDNYLTSIKREKNVSYSDIFLNTNAFITNSIEPLAKDILSCKMKSPAANIFFDAKAKEWISIIIDAFLNKKELSISIEDDKALENVANYLDDHYALDVSQEILESISMMSGTKLKKLFKQKYQSSITEYTQRRRVNIAETLLLNSSLKIRDVSEAVGYSSHSKFSACFKKYKGVYPSEIKKNVKKISSPCKCKEK